jgi:hypothetical protein
VQYFRKSSSGSKILGKIDWPRFYGKRDENVYTWYREVAHLGDSINATPNELFQQMKLLLKGEAMIWFDSLLLEMKEDPTKFTRALLKEFGVSDRRSLEMELRGCRQREGESVREYMRRLRTIQINYPECNEAQIRAQFEEGLLNEEVKRTVLLLSDTNLEDVVEKAVRAEQCFGWMKRGRGAAEKSEKKVLLTDSKAAEKGIPQGELKRTLEAIQEKLRALEDRLASSKQHSRPYRDSRDRDGRGRPICYQCGKSGHLARACQERKRESTSSSSAVNPSNPEDSTSKSTNKAMLVGHSQRVHTPLTVQGLVASQQEAITIDTGASVSLLAEERYWALRNAGRAPPLGPYEGEEIEGISGEALVVLGMTDVEVELGGVIRVVHWVVVKHPGYPFLVGNDTLERWGIVINFPRRVLLGEGMEPVPFSIDRSVAYVVQLSSLGAGEKVQEGATAKQGAPAVQQGESNDEELPPLLYDSDANEEEEEEEEMPRLIRVDDSDDEEEDFEQVASFGREEKEYIPVLTSFELFGRPEDEEERQDCSIGSPDWGGKSDRDEVMRILREKVEEAYCSPKEREELWDLVQDFKDVFVKELTEPGRAHYVPHQILTGEHPPLSCSSHRVSPKEQEVISQEVQKMLKAGVIRPSKSNWAFPVVIARKKDGGPRFCNDYRRLNAITKRDSYPLPRIDELLDQLGKAPYRSTFDLAAGYWQIAIREEDKEKTAFITREGLFEYNVLPMGLSNSPATFQRNMNIMLGDSLWNHAVIYIDDLMVYSTTFYEHLNHLRRVLGKVREAGIKIKVTKVFFLRQSTPFLGHLLVEGGIIPNPEKIRAVEEARIPTNRKELQRFLGLASYYRRFVHRFADVAEPLTRLVSKNQEWVWLEEQEEAYQELKRRLISAPILAHPDWKQRFIVQPDASAVAIGAVLAQQQEGREVVIRYASRILSSAERNYSTTERELLAIVWALQEFRPYLFGVHFLLQTDHKALVSMRSMQNPSSRLMRWSLLLQEYDFEIVHKKGKEHTNADALTRAPFIQEDLSRRESEGSHSVAVLATGGELPRSEEEIQRKGEGILQRIASLQREDPVLREIIQYLEKGDLPEDSKRARRIVAEAGQMWIDKEGRLFRQWWPQRAGQRDNTRQQLVVPEPLRKEILRSCHDDLLGGHLGFDKVYGKIREHYWWPSMYADTKEWIATCETCQVRKNPRLPKGGDLEPISVDAIWERLGMDLVGPFPVSYRGNRWILVIIDYLSSWIEAFALPDGSAESVARVFVEEVICRFGPPMKMTSDQGAQFMGKLLTEITRLLGIRKDSTTPYHPQCDGRAEKAIQMITDILAKYVGENQKDWDLYLPFALAAYRTTPQASTGESPFFLMFGRHPYSPLDLAVGIPQEKTASIQDFVDRLNEVRELARRNIKWAQGKQATEYNSKVEERSYSVGDLVMLLIPAKKKGRSKKLMSFWKGPYVIIDKRGRNNYLLQGVDNPKDIQKTHIDRLKDYRSGMHPAGELEVAEVLDEREKDGRKEYLIRWRNLTAKHNQWVAEEHLHASEEIRRFEFRRKEAEKGLESTRNPEGEQGEAKTAPSMREDFKITQESKRGVLGGGEKRNKGKERVIPQEERAQRSEYEREAQGESLKGNKESPESQVIAESLGGGELISEDSDDLISVEEVSPRLLEREATLGVEKSTSGATPTKKDTKKRSDPSKSTKSSKLPVRRSARQASSSYHNRGLKKFNSELEDAANNDLEDEIVKARVWGVSQRSSHPRVIYGISRGNSRKEV